MQAFLAGVSWFVESVFNWFCSLNVFAKAIIVVLAVLMLSGVSCRVGCRAGYFSGRLAGMREARRQDSDGGRRRFIFREDGTMVEGEELSADDTAVEPEDTAANHPAEANRLGRWIHD